MRVLIANGGIIPHGDDKEAFEAKIALCENICDDEQPARTFVTNNLKLSFNGKTYTPKREDVAAIVIDPPQEGLKPGEYQLGIVAGGFADFGGFEGSGSLSQYVTSAIINTGGRDFVEKLQCKECFTSCGR